MQTTNFANCIFRHSSRSSAKSSIAWTVFFSFPNMSPSITGYQMSRKRPTLCLPFFLAGCYRADMCRVLRSVVKNAVGIFAITACPARLLVKPFQRFLKDGMISSTRGHRDLVKYYWRISVTWQFSANHAKGKRCKVLLTEWCSTNRTSPLSIPRPNAEHHWGISLVN